MCETHLGSHQCASSHTAQSVCAAVLAPLVMSALSLDSGLTGQVEASRATGQSWADLAQSCEHPGPGHRLY